MKAILFITALVPQHGLATATLTKLVTFDGAEGTTFKWQDMNDPVMGGRSHSTFTVSKKVGVFNGTCAIVPSLNAPGFCKATTKSGFLRHNKFADISSHIDGHMELRVRTSTPGFAGFRVAFGAKNCPSTSRYGGGSFKSGFNLTDTAGWQLVKVPFTSFSYDWSGYTGRCDTKDPTGQQHHCCDAGANKKYCPTSTFLSTITDVEVWAEGAEGDFHLEIDYIGADS